VYYCGLQFTINEYVVVVHDAEFAFTNAAIKMHEEQILKNTNTKHQSPMSMVANKVPVQPIRHDD